MSFLHYQIILAIHLMVLCLAEIGGSPPAMAASTLNWAGLPPSKTAPDVIRPSQGHEIVGVRLENLSGQAGKITTFAQGFRQGDWPAGTHLVAMIAQQPIPVQADVKVRYEDGSVKHAVISLVNPQGDENAQVMLSHTSGSALEDSVGVSWLLRQGYNLSLIHI